MSKQTDERTIGTEAQASEWAKTWTARLSQTWEVVREVECASENLDRLAREVARLQTKATKLGFKPPVLVASPADYIAEVTEEVRDSDPDGETRTRLVTRKIRMLTAVIGGNEIRVDGWEIVAAVDWLGGQPVVRAFPGQETYTGQCRTITNYGAMCDHCGQHRARNTTYILGQPGGDLMQVGSTCLKDFCGLDPTYAAQVAALWEAGDWAGVGTRWEEDLWGFLEWCAAATRVCGRFVSRAQAEREYEQQLNDPRIGWGKASRPPTTADDANAMRRTSRDAVNPLPESSRPNDDDRATVAAVRAHVASLDPSQSSYNANLQSIFDSGILLPRHEGIAASAIGSYLREQQRVAEAALRAASTRPSQHLGVVGARVKFDCKVVSVHVTEGMYGTTHIYRLLTPQGDKLTWFSSRDGLDVGCEYTLIATVKKHETYRDEQQTVVTRATIA